jgi:hypothetical protein
MSEMKSTSILLQRLTAVLFKQRLVLAIAGLVTTLAALLAGWIVLSALANVMVLPVWLKISLLVIVAAGTAYLFTRFAIKRLMDGSIDNVAVNLEQKHPELRGRLIAAVQFARSGYNPSYSPDLIRMTEEQAIREAGLINLNEVVTFHPVLKTGRYFAIAAVVAVALLVLFPGFFSYSYEVYSNATTEIAPPLAYKVVPVPGSREWVKYQDITFGAAVVGVRVPDKASVYYRLMDGQWQKSDIDLRTLKHGGLGGYDSLTASVSLRQVNKSFDYYVEAGRIKTDIQKIDVVDRPRVNDIGLSIFYPPYTRLAPTTMKENNGSFSAVVGSRVSMKIETNLPIDKAELVFDDSSHLPLTVNGKTAEASLVVQKSQSYHIHLVDHLGETNPDPIEYYVTAVPDEYPTVDVVYPGYDVNLNEEMTLPLKLHISDDYGFSSLVMKYAITSAQGGKSSENVAVLHFSDNIKTEGDIDFNWDMNRLNMMPGDYCSYYFEVADNDKISGPKISKSRQFIARVPSLEEIVAQTDQEGKQRINETENLVQTGKDLVQRLKSAARKLDAQTQASQQQKADWQQQKELTSIAEKQAEMSKQIDKLAQAMDSSLEKMKDNALMSREILEKMQQIQKLFEEVATPEMREAQKKLMEALQQMDKQKIQEAMKNFQMSQKEMMERLERTLALLKKMQAEQKIEAMVRQAEQLLARQEKNNESTEKSQPDQLPKLSPAEQANKDAMDKLQQDVKDLRQLMQEAKMDQQPEAQKFADAVEKSQASEDMKNMTKSLNDQKKEESASQGKSAAKKLSEMLGEMQKQQMAMSSSNSNAVQQAMRKAMQDSNYLSKSQEDLLREGAAMDQYSMAIRDLATNQQDIASAAEGLKATVDQLGQASPFIAGEIKELLNNALSNMQQASKNLDGRQGSSAAMFQRDAMAGLNKASVRLMESLEQQQKCDKGGSCNKNVGNMESLTKKQMQLNQKTQGQCNNPGSGKMGQNGRQELERLAGEQGQIRKSVEEMAKEFGDSRQVLGRLDDIAREMKKVEEDMSSGTVGDETTERQMKIYSRMLEASRSLQRKDFTDQRKSTAATTEPVYLPPNLSQDLLGDRTKFEDRLRQFLGDSYPPQYEEQIKAYFRALLQIETNSGQSTPAVESKP